MLRAIVRLSLENRVLVVVAALAISMYGLLSLPRLPIDVLPDLNRPTVTIMTEAPGLAPEEVEVQVTYPIETAVNGAIGVERVRSISGLGLSIVWVEFGWETDIRFNRQVVQEGLTQVADQLPPGIVPHMGPISSIMGEIMLIGLTAEVDQEDLSPMQQRMIADWTIRPALLSIPGVSQITVMGGDVRQFQVRADADQLRRFELGITDLEAALREANENAGGGFVTGDHEELVVRHLGRVQSVPDIENTIVAVRRSHDVAFPVRVRDVARVTEAPALIKRGEGSMDGAPAVIMAISKQPDADTRRLTAAIDERLEQLRPSLPEGLYINADLFRQSHFITTAIHNVIEALWHGAVLVVIVLALFLLNFRTTAITLTAIPLSILTTFIVFHLMGMSINTMTLGGLAVAMGELVDDAIVGVENAYRRLRENRQREKPQAALRVIFNATLEVRGPIVIGTVIVLLVFLPLFFLPDIAGRLFQPLAIAYIVSVLMSMVVSLTISPVLAHYLLPGMAQIRGGGKRKKENRDGFLLRGAKWLALRCYGFSLPRPEAVLMMCGILVVVAIIGVFQMGREFLPHFNEGTATVNVVAMPGVSLKQADELGRMAESMLLEIPEIKATGRRTGRAEMDEHAQEVNASEIEVDFWTRAEARDPDAMAGHTGRRPPSRLRPREEVFIGIREKLEAIPGINIGIGQPISHRIDHLETGVRAQIVIKIFGDDLRLLRTLAEQAFEAMAHVDGVVDLQIQSQMQIPQLHFTVDRDRAASFGFTSRDLVRSLEIATRGRAISQVIDGVRTFDLVLVMDEPWQNDPDRLATMRLVSPTGAIALVRDVVEIRETPGPNSISRENTQRTMAVFCNVQGRDLGGTAVAVREAVMGAIDWPEGYSMQLEGQFLSQQEATRIILLLGLLSLLLMFFILYSYFGNWVMPAQVMLNIPFAFIGSVGALLLVGEDFSVASLVGFISLCGIASRNGVLMISHYLHLMVNEGMKFGEEMVIRGSQERVAPVLMTALTTGLGLIPLAIAAGQPGREILYPVAVVVIGGLVTSTILDFFVTPTVFLRFAKDAAERTVARRLSHDSNHSLQEFPHVHH